MHIKLFLVVCLLIESLIQQIETVKVLNYKFNVLYSNHVSSVYKTFNLVSEVQCAYALASCIQAGVCSSSTFNKNTRTCQLSVDSSEGIVDEEEGDSVILKLQDTVYDCYDVLHKKVGYESGVYTVFLPISLQPVQVYCDMVTNGGGWTVFQYRYDGSVSFYRNSTEYENGFGDLNGEFWLGLKYMHVLTEGSTSEVYLGFMDFNHDTAYETLQPFWIDGGPNYTLHVGGLITSTDGTPNPMFLRAGGSLLYNNGSAFSTFDEDRDIGYTNCAKNRHSGWWHRKCTRLNPNGKYVTPGIITDQAGMTNPAWREYEALKSTWLMFRRH